MKKKTLKSLPFLAGFVLSTSAYAWQAPLQAPSMEHRYIVNSSTMDVTIGAEKFIDDLATNALSFLGNEKLSQSEKKEAFKALLNKNFDMITIGRFALGRYWRPATKTQKSEYLKLFNTMIVEVYSQRFSDYQGQSFKVHGTTADSKKDTIVSSYIMPPQGPKVIVDWRVRYKDGKYRVIDVIVEGVSMSVTQRSDFSSVIQRGGGDVNVLINHLKGIVNQKG
jgi:phospholipid transport system substrate-binding protein